MTSRPGKSKDTHTPDACQAALNETARLLKKNHEMLVELNEKMDRLMKHLGVPYEKPPTGFLKD